MTAYQHLPLLRIAEPEFVLGEGRLVRLPFEQWDAMTQGAWSDHRLAYEATAPVFFVWELVGDRPARPLVEAYLAMLLAFPRAALPDPGLSWRAADNSTMQGLADVDLLLTPSAAGPVADHAVISYAERLLGVMDGFPDDGPIGAALNSLADATTLQLLPREQLTICTTALEALLLPEVTSGLTVTFARRLSNLVGTDDADRAAVSGLARALYDARSAVVHGGLGAGGEVGRRAATDATGHELLARALVALAWAHGAGHDIAAARSLLDAGPLAGVEQPLVPRTAARPVLRLGPTAGRVTVTISGHGLAAPERHLAMYAPCIGLTADIDDDTLDAVAAPLVRFTPSEIISLEDKDVRRDFIAPLHLSSTLPIGTGLHLPIVATRDGEDADFGDDDLDAVWDLVEPGRDLVVLLLRLQRKSRFTDPELLGRMAMFHGSMRYRRPTAYRQSILLGMNDAGDVTGDVISSADIPEIDALWALLADYHRSARHDAIDHVATLFRRAHDTIAVSDSMRMTLLFAALEAVIGRQPRRDDPVQTADLLGRSGAIDDETVAWFRTHGRSVRNAVAHGYWTSDEGPTGADALPAMRAVVNGMLRSLLVAWVSRPAGDDRLPRQVLVDVLEAEFRLAGI